MNTKIIENLEAARRLSNPDFEHIVLESAAVKVLINLFLHPGCKSDVNLVKFLTGKSIKLSELSPHIITAFPSQVSKYAQRKGILKITEVELLECFAIDHADAVEENQHSLLFEPSYSLAHVLTVGKVTNLVHFENRQLVELVVKSCGSDIKFSHVLIPSDVSVSLNTVVFHHFGVVVASANSKELKLLAKKLQREQHKKIFLQKTVKQVIGKSIKSIDYAKESFFKVDMTGQLLKESKKDYDFFRLWQEDDLDKIKLPAADKVMFSS